MEKNTNYDDDDDDGGDESCVVVAVTLLASFDFVFLLCGNGAQCD